MTRVLNSIRLRFEVLFWRTAAGLAGFALENGIDREVLSGALLILLWSSIAFFLGRKLGFLILAVVN